MPSVIIDNAFSGGQPLWSGNAFSGYRQPPVSQLLLKAAASNSGSIHVGFSAGFTITSGRFPLSGDGLLDGIPIAPGGEMTIPKIALRSGVAPLVRTEAAGSGRDRIFYQLY